MPGSPLNNDLCDPPLNSGLCDSTCQEESPSNYDFGMDDDENVSTDEQEDDSGILGNVEFHTGVWVSPTPSP